MQTFDHHFYKPKWRKIVLNADVVVCQTENFLPSCSSIIPFSRTLHFIFSCLTASVLTGVETKQLLLPTLITGEDSAHF